MRYSHTSNIYRYFLLWLSYLVNVSHYSTKYHHQDETPICTSCGQLFHPSNIWHNLHHRPVNIYVPRLYYHYMLWLSRHQIQIHKGKCQEWDRFIIANDLALVITFDFCSNSKSSLLDFLLGCRQSFNTEKIRVA